MIFENLSKLNADIVVDDSTNPAIVYIGSQYFQVPIVTKEEIWKYPQFITINYKWQYKIYDVNQFVERVVLQRLEWILSFPWPNLDIIRTDIRKICELCVSDKDDEYHRPVTVNNMLKISNKYKFIKTWKTIINPATQELSYIPFDSIGDALRAEEAFTREELETLLTKFNPDLKSLNGFSKKTLVFLPDNERYLASGYNANKTDFYTHFEPGPNVPVRLAQAITSDGIMPIYDRCHKHPLLNTIDKNALLSNQKISGINAVVAYIPEVHRSNMFLGGEIYGSRCFTSNEVMFERSIKIPYGIDDLRILPLNSVVSLNTIIAEHKETKEKFKFMLPYQHAELLRVETQSAFQVVADKQEDIGTNLVFLVKSSIGAARIVSENGLKGCIVPMQDAGYIRLSNGEKVYPDLITGPNGIKSGFSTVQLGSLALNMHLNKTHVDTTVYSDVHVKYIENMVNTVPLTKGVWISPFGYEIPCYLGVECVIITELSKDYTWGKVKITPELMRFFVTSGNEKLVEELMDKYQEPDLKRDINEMINCLLGKKADKHFNYDTKPEIFENIAVNMSFSTYKEKAQSILLEEAQQGFSISIGDYIVRIPSSKLINKYTVKIGQQYIYPYFYVEASKILLALRNQLPIDNIMANVNRYLRALEASLFNKKGLFNQAASVRVEGGFLRQLTCHLVPEGISVIADPWYEKESHPLNKEDTPWHIYDIGCRHPVLWLSQVYKRELWTITQFEDHLRKQDISLHHLINIHELKGCVLRNPIDCMKDQSDTDGDLYPVTVPLKCQEFLANSFSNPVISDIQQKWIKEYMQKEKKTIKYKSFQLHKISRKQFNLWYVNTLIAKDQVAFATLSLWQFNTAVEIMLNRNEITFDEFNDLAAIYVMLLQDYVIRGMKHSSSAKDFDKFLISNIQNHFDEVVHIFHKLDIPEYLIPLFAKVAELANTMEVTIYSKIVNGSRTHNVGDTSFTDLIRSFVQHNTSLIEEKFTFKTVTHKVLSQEIRK